MIMKHTNKEGLLQLGTTQNDIARKELQTYMGLLILAGVYRTNKKPIQHL